MCFGCSGECGGVCGCVWGGWCGGVGVVAIVESAELQATDRRKNLGGSCKQFKNSMKAAKLRRGYIFYICT